MKHIPLLTLWCMLALSCQNDPSSRNQQNTPAQVADDLEQVMESEIYSSRSSPDLVEALFEDALKQDPDLQALYDEVEKANTWEKDSMAAVRTFLNINERYWGDVKGQLRIMGDTVLRKTLESHFEQKQAAFEAAAAAQITTDSLIQLRSEQLANQMQALKILVSYEMIREYQQGKAPQTLFAPALIDKYEGLISTYEKEVKARMK